MPKLSMSRTWRFKEAKKSKREEKGNKEQLEIENDTNPRWYVIDTFNIYKFYWDAFVILCATYNGLTVPVEVAFEEINEYLDSFAFLHSLDVFIDFIFIIDIVINFLTSYIDTRSGNPIHNPQKICKRYMKAVFIFDFLSSLPSIAIGVTNVISLISSFEGLDKVFQERLGILRIFKLMALTKIDQVIANMHSGKEVKV